MVEWRKGNKLFTPKSQKPMCVYSCAHMCPCHACVSVYMSELGCCVCSFWSEHCEGHLLKSCSSPLLSSFPHLSSFNSSSHPQASLVPIPQTPSHGHTETSTMSASQLPSPPSLSVSCFSLLGGGHAPWRRVGCGSSSSGFSRLKHACPWARVGKSFHPGSWLDFPWVTENPTSLTTSTINFSQKAPVLTRQVQLRNLILILFLAEFIPRLAQQKKNMYLHLAPVIIYQTPYCY